MPDYFEQGFSVRKPMWHGLGVILNDYPGREEAMALAGHDFTVVEGPIYLPGQPIYGGPYDGALRQGPQVDGWKVLTRSDTGATLNVISDSYTVVQNDTGWDIVDAMIGEGALYETGITLKKGSVCSVLAWLDEPVTIPGDDSAILPWLNVSWTHDGSGALSCRPTSVRTVCWNTQTAAEAQGKRSGLEFTFRHTKHVHARIEDAKMAIRGVRQAHEEYIELATQLAYCPITTAQRERFVVEFIPMPPDALVSDTVKSNVEGARAGLRNLFDGPTIPEAHRLTAYGLHLAGGEFLDHIRPYRSDATYFGRSMLRREPAKAKMGQLVKEVATVY